MKIYSRIREQLAEECFNLSQILDNVQIGCGNNPEIKHIYNYLQEQALERHKLKKKLCIICQCNPRGYSGGRFYVLSLAMAAIESGCQVNFYTTNIPELKEIFNSNADQYPLVSKINFFTLPLTTKKTFDDDYECDLCLIAPHLKVEPIFVENVERFLKKTGAEAAFINFETPNWFNSMSSVSRNLEMWSGWIELSNLCTFVINISHEGMNYAKKYYTKPGIRHLVIWPYVTSRVYYSVLRETIKREKNILALIREGHGDHKGTDVVLSCLIPKFKDFEFTLLSGRPLSEPYKTKIQDKANKAGVRVSFKESLTEIDKWRLYKSCSHLLYLSTFEGFGLPPVEALIAGCQPICLQLPVLKEFSGEKIEYISKSGDTCQEIFEIVNNKNRVVELDYKYNLKASMARCSEQIKDLLDMAIIIEKERSIRESIKRKNILCDDIDEKKVAEEIISAMQNKRIIIRGPDILSKTGGYSSCMRDIFTCLRGLDLLIYFQPSQKHLCTKEYKEKVAKFFNIDVSRVIDFANNCYTLNDMILGFSPIDPQVYSKIDKNGASHYLYVFTETEVHPSNYDMEHQWKNNFNELNLDGIVTCTKGGSKYLSKLLSLPEVPVIGWPQTVEDLGEDAEVSRKFPEDLKLIKIDAEKSRVVSADEFLESDIKLFFMGEIQPRKNISQLIETFALAIADTDETHKISLLLKLSIGSHSRHLKTDDNVYILLRNWLRNIFSNHDNLNIQLINRLQIYFTTEYLEEKLLTSLFNNIDYYFNLSHGEGLGGPLVKAMANGVPAISSNFHALGDFINQDNSILVPYYHSYINNFNCSAYSKYNVWASYLYSDVIYSLKHAFNLKIDPSCFSRYTTLSSMAMETASNISSSKYFLNNFKLAFLTNSNF